MALNNLTLVSAAMSLIFVSALTMAVSTPHSFSSFLRKQGLRRCGDAHTIAGLDELLSDPNYVATVFCPADVYFKEVAARFRLSVDKLFQDRELLKRQVGAWVIPDKAMKTRDLKPGLSVVISSTGRPMQIYADDRDSDRVVKLWDSLPPDGQVIKPDITYNNIVVHVMEVN